MSTLLSMIWKRVSLPAVTAAVMGVVMSVPCIAQERPTYRVGSGITPPKLLRRVEPELSDEAREKRLEGTVVLTIVINEKGEPEDIKVARGLGHGLDEKAIEAVKQWRFEPGKLDGKPVRVSVAIEIRFNPLIQYPKAP